MQDLVTNIICVLLILTFLSCHNDHKTSFNKQDKIIYSFKSKKSNLELNCWLEKSKKYKARILSDNNTFLRIAFLDSLETVRFHIYCEKKISNLEVYDPFSLDGLPDTTILRVWKSINIGNKLYYFKREFINNKSFINIKYIFDHLGKKIESTYNSDTLKYVLTTVYYNKFEEDSIDDNLHYDLLRSIDIIKIN